MAKQIESITIKVNIKLGFWSAIKLRIAGKYLPEIQSFIKSIKKNGK